MAANYALQVAMSGEGDELQTGANLLHTRHVFCTILIVLFLEAKIATKYPFSMGIVFGFMRNYFHASCSHFALNDVENHAIALEH